MRKTYEIKGDIIHRADQDANKLGVTQNKYVNITLDTFSGLPRELKIIFAKCCMTQINKERKDKEFISGFSRSQADRRIRQLEKMLDFFNDFKNYPHNEENMKTVEIVDGYVIFPQNWIIINQSEARYCKYVYVIEMLNGTKYGTPHLIGFTNTPINNIDEKEEEEIYDKCEKVYPEFLNIRKMQVEKVYKESPEGYQVMENLDSWIKSPEIGIFAISEYGDPYGQFPFGAMIVRIEKDPENE